MNGLRKLKSSKNQPTGSKKGHTSPAGGSDLDKLLAEDEKTRKKRYSKFHWYHKDIQARQPAEARLRQSTGSAKHTTGVFLVRSSTACSDEFVLSFWMSNKIVHYNICNAKFPENYEFCFEKGPHFPGVDELIDFYQKNESKELPCRLSKPCSGGETPPPLAMNVGYTNVLHKAIMKGQEDEAVRILNHAKCPALDERDDKGNTALHLASASGLFAVAEVLVNKGAVVLANDRQGYSALHLACQNNHASLARMLIVNGDASLHQRIPKNGNVPIHLAAERGHIATIQMLLGLDVPNCSRNHDSKTPYELAKENGHIDCANVLDNYVAPDANTDRKDWFHEKISREEAVALFEQNGMKDGLFLIRKSSRGASSYVLDVCHARKIARYPITEFMTTYYIGMGPLLRSLEHLVEYYCIVADGLATMLTSAISPSGGVVSLEALSECFHKIPAVPIRDRPPPASEPMVLSRDSITTTHELGQGEFGSVLKGIWKAPSGELVPVAIKTLNPQHLITGKEGFLREAQVMVQLDHPCIVKLIGICQEPQLMLVQELLAEGSLLDYLFDYPEKVKLDVDAPVWASQIAFGMKYLEKQGYVHRDLAARNILLASKTQVKICDFGLSRAIGAHSDYYKAAHGGKWPVKWYAPESINYGTFSSASDVWGYGVTLWEIYTLGEQPYGDMTGAQVLQFIEHQGRLERPSDCPINMYALMLRCWSYRPPDRPTFTQIHEEMQDSSNYVNVHIKNS